MSFTKAEKQGIRLRLGLCGPTGSGKTWWALSVATLLAKHFGGRFAVIDSERGSAKKYGDKFDFDVAELASFEPEKYIAELGDAEAGKYNVVVVDSLSHAWAGQGGVLDRVDAVAKKQAKPNTYTAWREGTKLQNDLVETILAYPGHVVVTMRTKMDYEQVVNEQGKKEIRKIGLQPVQRDGLEYEFDIVADVNMEHELMVAKTRCADIADKVFRKHEAEKFVATVIKWLGDQSTVNDVPKDKETDRDRLIKRIEAGEKAVYESTKHRDNARKKYLDTANLSEATDDKLAEYFKHIGDKYHEAKAKPAGSTVKPLEAKPIIEKILEYEKVLGWPEPECLAARESILTEHAGGKVGAPTHDLSKCNAIVLQRYIDNMLKPAIAAMDKEKVA